MTAPSHTSPGQMRNTAERRELRSSHRLLQFSDGVFAIAVTLLALDVRLPQLGPGPIHDELPRAMLGLLPMLLAYAMSFLVIATYWTGHHRMFHVIPLCDSRLVWINVLLLMTVSVLPLPTSLLSKYGQESIVVAAYALSMAVAGALSALLWWYAGHARLTDNVTPRQRRQVLEMILVPPLIFVLSAPLAYVSPMVAEFSWLTVFISRGVIARRHGSRGPEAI